MSMVGLRHYEGLGIDGFGLGSIQKVQQLNKALEAGYETNPALMSGGAAHKVESLEGNLKILTHTDRHLVFWRDIFKSPAYSTSEEYGVQESYGDNGYGAFYKEGELPLENDSVYRRKTALVKYMGTVRKISHPATLIHPAFGDLIAKENESGIMWLLRQVEEYLFRGNSRLVFQGEGEQFDGLRHLIDPTMVLDLEGNALQEADFEESSNLLASAGFAYPTDAYLGYYPLSDLVKTMYPRHRVSLPAPTDGRIGQAVNEITTQAGIINLKATRFLERPDTAPTVASGPATHVPTPPKRMLAPTIGATATTGEFDKSQGKLDAKYAYVASFANRFGESAATAPVVSPTMVGADAIKGRDIVLQVEGADNTQIPPEYIRIYRTAALDVNDATPTDMAAYSLVMEIPVESQSNNGITPQVAGTLTDKNITMPFMEELYLGEMTPEVLTFRQLAPLMKMELAVNGPAYTWMIMLYGVPILYGPKKWMRITNIGRLGL